MTFIDVIKAILLSSEEPVTPQMIRKIIKAEYPELYGTDSHIKNVNKGHYKDLDHALLAQIYGAVRSGKHFYCDVSSKPMLISL